MQNYKAGLYIRLSKEDKNESISNQKNLLIKYATDNNITIINTYIDDGYTGTNFNRPGFKKLLADINNLNINTVIVKDLSRLGRNYIKTGELIEDYFPTHNIRFISINDNIDTINDNANIDIAPFKAILNDLYSKDLSKKIRSARKTMQELGLWTGGCIPLGYMQSKTNKNKLIINKKESNIVKRIFELYLNNNSINDIKTLFNKEKIPTFSKLRKNKNNSWTNQSIKKILTNPIYTGCLSQNKSQRLSYKYRRTINNDKSNWIIVNNTHPNLISKKDFEKVQNTFKIKQSRCDKLEERLLDNLLYCYECKHHLSIRKQKKHSYLCCNNYKYRKDYCTAHGFNYETLEKDIIDILNAKFNIPITREKLLNLIDKIEISKDKSVYIFLKDYYP